MSLPRDGGTLAGVGACAETNSCGSSVATRWWVYLLLCRDGRTYAGVAIDVARRFRLHQMGKGAKFTRANPPLEILGVQPCVDRSTALRAEYALKQLTHAEKLAWAQVLGRRP